MDPHFNPLLTKIFAHYDIPISPVALFGLPKRKDKPHNPKRAQVRPKSICWGWLNGLHITPFFKSKENTVNVLAKQSYFRQNKCFI